MNIAKKSVDGTDLVFSWADGTTTTIDCTQFSDAIKERGMMHGFSQKFGDSYASAESLEDAKERFDAVLNAVKEGDWNRKGVPSGGIWVQAIAEVTGIEFAEALTKWNAMDKDTKSAVRKHPDVIQAKLKIDLARASEKASTAQPLVL